MRHLITQALLTALISFGTGYILAPHASQASKVNEFITVKPTVSVEAKLKAIAAQDPDAFDMDNLEYIGVRKYMCSGPSYYSNEVKALCIQLKGVK